MNPPRVIAHRRRRDRPGIEKLVIPSKIRSNQKRYTNKLGKKRLRSTICMHKQKTALILALALSSLPAARAANPKDVPQTWSFAVSGDSRNCGDVVMPAIAADAIKHNVAFYWHLGHLRAIYRPTQAFVEHNIRT